ncbi:MAG: DNA repair protein RecO [Pelagibacterales bacterium MED-G40]|nr:MAG: DNA repair protein RecO [Candidatus Pelagibacter sp. TMED203]PDH19515.1 MAG: DNA repair protein RecO [Pelagibacterales bacterium MED-G40]|tara:strand:- start:16358 stop:17038 length:681 start_codon:yes stop_codon:yes gene_type:complete
MNWEDEGYLLSKRKFRENANIINVFTNTFGKVSGIVYGGNSRKIRNYLQISNKIFIFYNSKNENKIGYFKTELVEPISPKYFNDKKRSAALMSLTSLLNVLLPESQPYRNIYNSLEKLLQNLYQDQWILLFIYWELSLIKELGFDTNISKFNSMNYSNNELVIVDIDNSKYQIPSFLIKNVMPKSIDNHLIKKSLIFTRSIMLNKFFLPNNLNLPKSRVLLENYFN